MSQLTKLTPHDTVADCNLTPLLAAEEAQSPKTAPSPSRAPVAGSPRASWLSMTPRMQAFSQLKWYYTKGPGQGDEPSAGAVFTAPAQTCFVQPQNLLVPSTLPARAVMRVSS